MAERIGKINWNIAAELFAQDLLRTIPNKNTGLKLKEQTKLLESNSSFAVPEKYRAVLALQTSSIMTDSIIFQNQITLSTLFAHWRLDWVINRNVLRFVVEERRTLMYLSHCCSRICFRGEGWSLEAMVLSGGGRGEQTQAGLVGISTTWPTGIAAGKPGSACWNHSSHKY
jgi:hypothetical protein